MQTSELSMRIERLIKTLSHCGLHELICSTLSLSFVPATIHEYNRVLHQGRIFAPVGPRLRRENQRPKEPLYTLASGACEAIVEEHPDDCHHGKATVINTAFIFAVIPTFFAILSGPQTR